MFLVVKCIFPFVPALWSHDAYLATDANHNQTLPSSPITGSARQDCDLVLQAHLTQNPSFTIEISKLHISVGIFGFKKVSIRIPMATSFRQGGSHMPHVATSSGRGGAYGNSVRYFPGSGSKGMDFRGYLPGSRMYPHVTCTYLLGARGYPRKSGIKVLEPGMLI